MAVEVLMPKQGNSVESCIILDWKKNEGDAVSVGDVLCEAETDKSTIEVESTAAGTILKLLYAVGEEAPVQTPIAIVGEPGETYEQSATAAESVPEKITTPIIETAPSTPVSSEQTRTTSETAVSPRARSTAEKSGIDASVLPGSGAKGRVIERDVLSALANRPPVSPAAMDALRTKNVSVPVSGSGIGGRVVLSDLNKPTAETVPSAHEIPVKSVRKVIAKRMRESLATTAQLTMNIYADATALRQLRTKLKESNPALGLQQITINDLILFAVSRTLVAFPYMNSHFLGDKIVEFEHVNLGFAVDTAKGLLVPVIKGADMLSLAQISKSCKALAAAAIDGKSSLEDLSGGTFTVTNLGSSGIDTFTPILNAPEVGILGVGGVSLRPVERKDGSVAFVEHIGLSLTIDHQSVDGAPGARFLKALAEHIASIDVLLSL